MRIPGVRLQRTELLALLAHRLHRRQCELGKACIERIHGVPVRATGNRCGDELGCDFHVAQRIDKLELLLEPFEVIDDGRASAAEDVRDDAVVERSC